LKGNQRHSGGSNGDNERANNSDCEEEWEEGIPLHILSQEQLENTANNSMIEAERIGDQDQKMVEDMSDGTNELNLIGEAINRLQSSLKSAVKSLEEVNSESEIVSQNLAKLDAICSENRVALSSVIRNAAVARENSNLVLHEYSRRLLEAITQQVRLRFCCY